jgi:hypothetical protein
MIYAKHEKQFTPANSVLITVILDLCTLGQGKTESHLTYKILSAYRYDNLTR